MRQAGRFSPSRVWHGLDQTLLFTLAGLIVVGLTLSLAASPAAAERLRLADPFYFVYRHIFFVILSVVVLMVMAALSPRGVRRFAGLALVFSILALIAVPFIGYEVNGAARWLRLGGFSFQPSELFKPAFIVIRGGRGLFHAGPCAVTGSLPSWLRPAGPARPRPTWPSTPSAGAGLQAWGRVRAR